MIHRVGVLGEIICALVIGLFVGLVTALWFSSWRETTANVIFLVGFQFLVGLSIGALTRGPKAGVAVITCAVSLLGWPAWNGLLRQFEGLEFYGILEVVPVMIGGFLALIIRKQAARHR